MIQIAIGDERNKADDVPAQAGIGAFQLPVNFWLNNLTGYMVAYIK